MSRIDIQGGLERDEFYDKNGNLIGVAEYDLNDSSVRLKVLQFANTMQSNWQEFLDKSNTLPSETLDDIIVKTAMEVDFVNGLKEDADEVFGEDFCQKALGKACNNVLTLLEVLNGIVSKYGSQPNLQIERLVNGNKNREQRRLASRK